MGSDSARRRLAGEARTIDVLGDLLLRQPAVAIFAFLVQCLINSLTFAWDCPILKKRCPALLPPRL